MEPSRSLVPKIELQSPAVDFIDNRLPKYHPAFANRSTRYDSNLGRYVAASEVAMTISDAPEVTAPAADLGEGIPAVDMALPPRPLPSPIEAMKFWDAIFDDSMEKFMVVVKGIDDPAEPQHTIRNQANWDGIYNRLEVSRDKYNSTEGISGRTKKIYRRIAGNCQPLIQMTNLAPQSEYTTPVLGVVQLVLEAVERAGKVREKILGGFDKLDVIFSEVELFLETFPSDPNIRTASVELIAIVFRAVEQAISFFNKSFFGLLHLSGRRAFGAIGKKDDYQRDIVDSIQKIEEGSQHLIRQAENSFIYSVSHAMVEVQRRVRGWSAKCEEVLHRLEIIQQKQEAIKDSIDRIEHNMLSETSVKELIRLVLEEYVPSRRDQDQRSVSPIPDTTSAWQPPPNTRYCISPEELWRLLSVPSLEVEDSEFVNSRAGLLPSDERAQTEQLVKCRQFLEWAVSPTSTRLLVHGNFEGRPYVSALSLFCVTLFESLKESPSRFIPLIFFCGLHVNALTDPHAGGRALIKCFISQLLRQRPFDTSALQTDDEEVVRRGDISGLCNLFWWLVAQLPVDQTVFLLIDGVGYYEREDFEVDTGHVLDTLLTPRVDGETAIVKVMLTHPSGTRRMRERVGSGWTVSMAAMPTGAGTGNKRALGRGFKNLGT
ncbi:hypothetical protein CEP52_004252 [Fusarium oligoseptatum]|uniref:Uncharacterized protein n=1 Tax=Fusarium oligoseptatum TaxID=2604345 RepID=A0A428U4D8_9HYPO|nr:hypothetical protein CEP52_004252 [Fusarium oligoseptatum]